MPQGGRDQAASTRPPAARRTSRNKWQAVYILGQIYHSLGKAADAIREYRRVEDRFADARQAIEYFLRKAIELPEVSTFKPGERAEVELKFRNVAACDLKVYRIDLMKFGLLKRNLRGIAEINLAGIRPLHEADDRAGRRPRLPRPHAQARRCRLKRRRGVSGRLPRRRSARQRAGAGHAAGGGSPGRRRLRPSPHHRQGPRRRQVSPRRRASR